MDIQLEIKEALHYMLLPIPLSQEEKALETIHKLLEDNDIDTNAYSTYIKVKYDIWRSDKTLDELLKKIIKTALSASNPQFGVLIAEKYLDIHSALLKNSVSFEVAVILLSHLHLIVTLAVEEKMSAAKIAKVLKSINHRLEFISWKEVQNMLKILRLTPELTPDIELIYAEDENLEGQYFADADMDDSAFQVGEVAKNLQFGYDAEQLLKKLTQEGQAHLPYLQILHYQCLISGFYDHVPSVSYEFNPRGVLANWLFAKWDALLHTSNPFLNNAKAVDILNEDWARSRKANEVQQANALVNLLKGLDGMGFAAAQELSAWIRRLLVRYIKINSIATIPIDVNLNDQQISTILKGIYTKPTATYGILEQRYVDIVAFIIHVKDKNWRARGISDSVNSNNLSKRKLGDCDFQNSVTKTIVAYEAHGGKLSKIYLEGHLRTLNRSLNLRIEELERIADLAEWKLKVVFVAYGFEDNFPGSYTINGLQIELQYFTFEELLSQIDPTTKDFKRHFKTLFIQVINDRRTPSFVREYLAKVI
jgi:hypothetical protein